MNIEKQASLWAISDIEELAGTGEGPYIEFKKPSEFIEKRVFSREGFTIQLTETVSAFLNSDGGVIIVGAQTNRDLRDKKVELMKPLATWSPEQTLEHLKIPLTESQVRDLIHANIMPKPSGVEVKALSVPVGDSTATVFVITVPRSSFGAHQSTKTRRYYRRTADGDEPMLDYEIRDVNNRRAGPVLRLACAVRNTSGIIYEEDWKTSQTQTNQVDKHGTFFSRVNVVFSALNLGRGTASVAKFDVGIPSPWQVHNYSPSGTNFGAHWEPNNALELLVGKRVSVFWIPGLCDDFVLRRIQKGISEEMVGWQTVVYNSNELPAYPIWPTAGRVVIGELELQLQNSPNVATRFWLPWRILAEGMPETRGTVLLTCASGHFRINNYEMDEASWCGEAEDDQTFEALKQRFHVG